MYKRESLERMLAMSPDDEVPDLALVCAGCKAPVTRRKNEAHKSRKHVHAVAYGDSLLSLGAWPIFSWHLKPCVRHTIRVILFTRAEYLKSTQVDLRNILKRSHLILQR